MDKKYKYNFEPQNSFSLYQNMLHISSALVQGYYREVKPVLVFCGLEQDGFIRKTFEFSNMQPIYAEAMETNAERLRLFEEIAEAKGEDFWAFLRDQDCRVKKPTENGFTFRELPWANTPKWLLDKGIKTIRIKDGNVSEDDKLVRKESFCHPTEKMHELYDLTTDFCKAINAMNIKRPRILDWLFEKDKDGNIKPSERGILFGCNKGG